MKDKKNEMYDKNYYINYFKELSRISKNDGKLALENEISKAPTPLCAKGLSLFIDNITFQNMYFRFRKQPKIRTLPSRLLNNRAFPCECRKIKAINKNQIKNNLIIVEGILCLVEGVTNAELEERLNCIKEYEVQKDKNHSLAKKDENPSLNDE